MENYTGEKFLNKLYSNLHMSDEVMHTSSNKDTKEERIRKYLERINKVHDLAQNNHKKNLLKKLYYEKYVIKLENIPKYLSFEDKMIIINDQKKTLSDWLDYLMDKNAIYPMWAKYWAFQGMLKMGTYDEASGTYQKRSNKTIAKFIDVNPEIIANCIENIIKSIDKEDISNSEINEIVKTGSFSKLYTLFENKYKKNTSNLVESNNGEWIKYNQGNKEDAKKLYQSLQNKNTGWCTASDQMANLHIRSGDFYVYYTKDKEGKYTFPRIAIRMDNTDKIAEIRGIEYGQSLEQKMEPILEKKLKEMTFVNIDDINYYLQKLVKLKELITINEKTESNIELTDEEIYNLYFSQYGFGWKSDSRVIEILNKRDNKKDLSRLEKIDYRNEIFYDNLSRLNPNSTLRDDKNFNINMIKYHHDDDEQAFIIGKKLSDDEDFLLNIIHYDARLIEYASNRLKNDKTFILKIVRENGFALRYMNEKMRDDEEVALEAIKIDLDAITGVSDRLWNDKSFILKAVKEEPLILRFISDKFTDDEEIIYEAALVDPDCVKYDMSDRLKNDKEFIKKINNELTKIGKENITFQNSNSEDEWWNNYEDDYEEDYNEELYDSDDLDYDDFENDEHIKI